jgi:hypothetical protein
MSRRPHFRRSVEDFIATRGVDGYTGMANDFIRAGYPEKMYTQLLKGWVYPNHGVADTFYL